MFGIPWIEPPGPVLLEVEIKYRLKNRDDLISRLRTANAVHLIDRVDVDTYLNAPDRDFAKTDEAVRIRRIGERLLLTYKGPRRDSSTKTRREIEVEVGSGDAQASKLVQFFTSLGYRKVADVVKNRHVYQMPWGRFTLYICLDDVQYVGSFAELEIESSEEDYLEARESIMLAARQLGLDEPESRSYLEQLLGHAVTPGGERC